MSENKPEKVEVLCPDCLTKNEILFLPSKKHKIQISGTASGTSSKWIGREEKVQGKCTKCGYKFKVDDI